LFIKRGEKKDRKRIIKDITDRLNLIEKEETMPPIAIFPEGTVSNGKAILEFKMGPFKDFKPLKILAFKVPYTRFSPYDDFILPQLSTILLLMSNWCNTCTLYEFEGVFDPAYLKLD